MTLHVASFGGGVVIAAAADQRRIDEVLEADSFDLGLRGALVAASDVTNYTSLLDGDVVPAVWRALHAIVPAFPGFDQTKVLAIGEGNGAYPLGPGSPIGPAYLLVGVPRAGAGATIGSPVVVDLPPPGVVAPTVPAMEGIVVTGCSWPGVFTIHLAPAPAFTFNVAFVCLGAREGFAPRSNPAFGLYAVVLGPLAPPVQAWAISNFNALGTGPAGDGSGTDMGTKSQQLFFRGIIDYNAHLFGWGFDAADLVNGDGPSRVMFCNLNKPFKWGNDNIAAVGVDRLFTDSDALLLGDAGEIVRAAIKLFGRLYFGTNKGLHFIAGFGRDSFLTDGSTPVMKAFNVTGPHGLIEGPDKLMYGVCDRGLWSYDGAGVPSALFAKLIDYAGHSAGWWDLIWTDLSRNPAVYPGVTNQDLVWMAVDWDQNQVLVGIPWCNAVSGAGYGLDTVVIKYHVLTGGFTRQVFSGVQFTAAAYARRAGQTPDVRFVGTATPGRVTIERYAYKAAAGSSPVMPSALPVATLGPYAPFGPDGRGSLGRIYLTVAWESDASLPIIFRVSTWWDGRQSDDQLLTIGPFAPLLPALNDLWLDTSLSDFNIGNGAPGGLVAAFPAYLLKRWTGTSWQQMPGLGTNGTRATVRFPMDPRNGTRVKMRVQCVAAIGRFEIEGLGEDPTGGSPSA